LKKYIKSTPIKGVTSSS